MTATILDGKATLAAIKEELRVRVKALADAGRTPGLGTILVGDDPGSRAYVNGKHRDCADVGIVSIRRDLPGDASQADVEAAVDELNADPACTGYLVQLPLPAGLDEQRVLERVDPAKDADGLHPVSLGRLVLMAPAPLPCTPRGIVELLLRYGVPLRGAEVVVIGRGTTVGRPLGLVLTRRTENATVTICHTGTRDLADHTRGRHHRGGGRGGRPDHDRHGPSRRHRARRRHHPGGRRRRQGSAGRRRAPRCGRRGRVRGADAGRGRADDPGDASHECR